MATEKQPVKASIAAFVGTMVEWYDFYIYGTAAALVLGQLFFPGGSPFERTLAAFGTFAVGFFARPLGGIVFGTLGDKFGRKKSLVITLSLMGFSTICVGLLPTYNQIGVAAPVLLVLLRLLQGIAVGGEWGGAVLMASEHAPSEKQNFFASFAQLGSPAGLILSILSFRIVSAMDNDFFLSWGWRLPFLASIVMLAIGIFIRTGVNESPEFEKLKQRKQLSEKPVVEAWTQAWPLILLALAANALGISGGYFTNTFMITYAVQYLSMNKALVLECIFYVAIIQFFAQPVGAWIASKISPFRFLVLSAGLSILLPYPMFILVGTKVFSLMVLGIGMAMVGLCTFYAVIAGYTASVFPARYRYVGISLAYQLGGATFGGLTPLLGTLLAQHFIGQWWPMALFFSGISAISLISVIALQALHRRREVLANTPALVTR
ncbi:MFS transporter [Paraburkholderia bannensis]|uniref:MFS transporter n=1 Tax=Paraburkholderia bannensis TaxID=765414 RepID=UPI002AB6284F|nr:MFS transporter [Paraburkholderia bannensis]